MTDTKHGDFDTRGVIYVETPSGDKIDINRYFKDSDNEYGWEEIGIDEYKERYEARI